MKRGVISTLIRRVYVECFFFQAEDGIRDLTVTGVQTCALPICDVAAIGAGEARGCAPAGERASLTTRRNRSRFECLQTGSLGATGCRARAKIGRASCRERV